ncbi:zinc finger C2HC domain-containing protein 1A [Aplochiton taeniatus]
MMDEFEDGEAPPGEELNPCQICGRRFFPKVLKKHIPICQKAAAKKRKVFDSSRQRAEGTDISTVKPIKPKVGPPKKPSNWRRKHEDFIATIRAAKGLTQVMKDGGPLPPPPPPSYDPDYIQCPYCQRRFSENAADRHIKFCREQAARIPNKGKLAAAEPKKPPARSQLKPPSKKSNSPTVSSIPSASSRLPQRSSPGQTAGVPSSKASSANLGRNTSSGYLPNRNPPSGLASPPSGVGLKNNPVGSYGSVKSPQTGVGALNKKNVYNADNYNSRNDAKSGSEVDNGATQSKFCHDCGTKFPVEWAKFCCECGVKRMCM